MIFQNLIAQLLDSPYHIPIFDALIHYIVYIYEKFWDLYFLGVIYVAFLLLFYSLDEIKKIKTLFHNCRTVPIISYDMMCLFEFIKWYEEFWDLAFFLEWLTSLLCYYLTLLMIFKTLLHIFRTTPIIYQGIICLFTKYKRSPGILDFLE